MNQGQETTRALDLPADVVDRVEARVSRTEFDSAAAYVAWVLDEVLAEAETEADEDGHAAVDEAQVKDRLESLGYLNE
jgi:hypothetical protein